MLMDYILMFVGRRALLSVEGCDMPVRNLAGTVAEILRWSNQEAERWEKA
jgi:hypothetical protein